MKGILKRQGHPEESEASLLMLKKKNGKTLMRAALLWTWWTRTRPRSPKNVTRTMISKNQHHHQQRRAMQIDRDAIAELKQGIKQQQKDVDEKFGQLFELMTDMRE
mmetsp:Transcript_12636/g.22523  ORF Transcript_12636/g.22523 Transcript_12636/m.22523 type:complete len:106 (+) Transcript_12636:287-604(+)